MKKTYPIIIGYEMQSDGTSRKPAYYTRIEYAESFDDAKRRAIHALCCHRGYCIELYRQNKRGETEAYYWSFGTGGWDKRPDIARDAAVSFD